MLAVAVVCTGCGRRPHAAPANSDAAIQDSVRTALATYQRYAAAARWDSLVQLYSTDSSFRWIESGHRYRGPLLRQVLAGMGSVRAETRYDSTEVAALTPGLAVLTTYYETRLVGPSPAHFGGAISMMWRHESGGWRIIGGHSSSAAPHSVP